MGFKIGDRVRISEVAEQAFIKQANGNTGTIIRETMYKIQFDHGYVNNYPLTVLINANEHQPMEELEITLDEIESYQEIYRKLEEEKT